MVFDLGLDLFPSITVRDAVERRRSALCLTTGFCILLTFASVRADFLIRGFAAVRFGPHLYSANIITASTSGIRKYVGLLIIVPTRPMVASAISAIMNHDGNRLINYPSFRQGLFLVIKKLWWPHWVGAVYPFQAYG